MRILTKKEAVMPRIMRLLCVFSVLTLVVAWHGSAGAQGSDRGGKGIKVKILLYSGRPDPTYILEQKDSVDRVKTLVKKAKKIKFKEKTIIPSILGYRGIIVENPGRAAELPERFAVYKGKIEVTGEKRAVYSDEGRTLEKFLLKEAEKQKAIDEKMLKRMEIDEMK